MEGEAGSLVHDELDAAAVSKTHKALVLTGERIPDGFGSLAALGAHPSYAAPS